MATIQETLQSTQDLLKRIKTEGITDASGNVLRTPQQAMETFVSAQDKYLQNLSNQNPELADSIMDKLGYSTGQIKLPEQTQVTPDLSTASGRMSYYDQFIKDEEARAVKVEADRQELIKERQAQREKQTGILGALKGIGQKRTEELSALGFEPTAQFAQQKAQLAEVDALYKDYNSAVAMRDQQIANVMGRPGQSMDFLNNQVAQINRNANVLLTQKSSNINSKLAVIEAQQGNFTEAQKFVDQSIKDYTAGLTSDYEMLESFISDNNSLISSLGTEYTSALNSRKALILDKISQAATDKQNEITNELNKYKAVTDRIQQERLSKGTGGTDAINNNIGTSRFDNGLNLLLQETPGLSAGQLYDLYVNNYDGNLTDAQEAELWKRAQVVAGQKPTTLTETSTTSASTNNQNYKDAGNGLVWTPDGKMIKKSEIQSDIQKNKSNFTTGKTENQGLWKSITNFFFGKK